MRGTLEIRQMKKPVVAVIEGIAAGAGFSIALACDFRVMAQAARFQQAYTSAGLCIDGGGTFMLPRLLGVARAMEIAAFDEPITAQQAFEWGLITKLVGDGKAKEEAMIMLNNLTTRSIHSFGWSKGLINNAFYNSLETQLEQERIGMVTCADHPDGLEGLRAFQEKRTPRFSHTKLD